MTYALFWFGWKAKATQLVKDLFEVYLRCAVKCMLKVVERPELQIFIHALVIALKERFLNSWRSCLHEWLFHVSSIEEETSWIILCKQADEGYHAPSEEMEIVTEEVSRGMESCWQVSAFAFT